MKKIKILAFLLLFCCSLMAQYGRLDKTFTSSGFTKFTTGKDDSSFQTTGTKAFVQSDGKIITLYESGGMTLLSPAAARFLTVNLHFRGCRGVESPLYCPFYQPTG